MELITRTFHQLSTEELYDIMVLRSEVFVVEQNCVYLDPDGIDKDSLHVFLRDEEGILAYARLFVKSKDPLTVQIGRVVAKVRRKGYGTVVLRECVRQAEDFFGAEEIVLEISLTLLVDEEVKTLEMPVPYNYDGDEILQLIMSDVMPIDPDSKDD